MAKWVHLVAIGGTGMGALAAMLKRQGWRVTGSDHPLYPPMSDFLRSEGIEYKAFGVENLKGATWSISQDLPDLVIVGNAISRSHPEAQLVEGLLAEKKLERMSFAQALSSFAIAEKRSLVVAGTHGKTTTTSLLAWALEVAGLKPGFFIGGIPKNFGLGLRAGEAQHFAVEGDEYDTAYWDKGSKFLHYKAAWALVTGIEYDHADIYPNVQDVEASFVRLAGRIREGCVLVDVSSAPRHGSVEVMRAALESAGKQFVRYGTNPHSKYQLRGVHAKFGTTVLSLVVDGEVWTLESPLSGQHNALNVLGVIALLKESGVVWTEELASQWLKSFTGIRRRQEIVHADSSRIVMDDFAHHPTAIRETLAAVRRSYPEAELSAFFEARSATSARKVMQADFEKCFDLADAVYLSPPSKSNVPEAEKMDIHELASTLKQRLAPRRVFVSQNLSELVAAFRSGSSQKLRIAVVMSNGPFGNIHAELAKKD
jgi:UDP-N-acetylmuramate: L-alanyl-gamma-D-glutamyl-meso-diaminopimelate ligase